MSKTHDIIEKADDVILTLTVDEDKAVQRYSIAFTGESPRLEGDGKELMALYEALGNALAWIGKR